MTLDEDDRRYLNDKFDAIHTRINALAQRVTAVETTLSNGDGPVRRRELSLAMESAETKHINLLTRIRVVDDGQKVLVKRLWAVVFLVITAVVSVWLTSTLQNPVDEIKEIKQELRDRVKRGDAR